MIVLGLALSHACTKKNGRRSKQTALLSSLSLNTRESIIMAFGEKTMTVAENTGSMGGNKHQVEIWVATPPRPSRDRLEHRLLNLVCPLVPTIRETRERL